MMVDADLTYDFAEIPSFVRELDAGAQLVVGNRMKGIQPGAMSRVSRVGNPILSGFLNMLYRTNAGDVHCGMRALRRDVLPVLDLRTTGMEFASEMVIRAARERLDVREIPIELHPRVGESKLAPFRDGWRHLRIILVYHPNFLFTLPGTLMIVAGTAIAVVVIAQVPVVGRDLQTHSLIGGSLLVILGVQAVSFGICARAYNAYFVRRGGSVLRPCPLAPAARARARAGRATRGDGSRPHGRDLRHVGLAGLRRLREEKLAIVAATVIAVGAQVFFTSFLLSILGLRWRSAS